MERQFYGWRIRTRPVVQEIGRAQPLELVEQTVHFRRLDFHIREPGSLPVPAVTPAFELHFFAAPPFDLQGRDLVSPKGKEILFPKVLEILVKGLPDGLTDQENIAGVAELGVPGVPGRIHTADQQLRPAVSNLETDLERRIVKAERSQVLLLPHLPRRLQTPEFTQEYVEGRLVYLRFRRCGQRPLVRLFQSDGRLLAGSHLYGFDLIRAEREKTPGLPLGGFLLLLFYHFEIVEIASHQQEYDEINRGVSPPHLWDLLTLATVNPQIRMASGTSTRTIQKTAFACPWVSSTGLFFA